ncbi:hypothetical protein AWM70_06430 [Paenibacillus yonginensis]|uniref:Uncharacterized protein n=1 Tax=Paenibacillus yonginensis TaxID=1462996 RepID=A0A1B1MYK3_9BACL|nr:hypothetical protein AWM70_06430 [Paenibacillus yonginensis]
MVNKTRILSVILLLTALAPSQRRQQNKAPHHPVKLRVKLRQRRPTFSPVNMIQQAFNMHLLIMVKWSFRERLPK